MSIFLDLRLLLRMNLYFSFNHLEILIPFFIIFFFRELRMKYERLKEIMGINTDNGAAYRFIFYYFYFYFIFFFF